MTPPASRQETSPLWVRRLAPRPSAQVRLFCFPYAGGSAAMFRDWPHALPAAVEPLAIQLPGRADRMAEKPYERMDLLVECLAELLRPDLDRPFTFFGYSMGARVAVNLAHALRKSGGPSPQLLLVAASPGPSLPIAVPGWDQPDQALITYLRDLGGTPAEVLANPELLALLLPTVRADLTVVATCRRQPRVPLSIPVHALAGRDDSYASPERMVAWHGETTGPFRLSVLPGGHFFVDSAARALVELVASELVSLSEQMASGLSTASARRDPG
jgi:medium-chain acyl-[acyl-carrier-protein] hydrolase